MRTRLAAAVALLASSASPAHAHRLDEYLQATTIEVGRERVQTQLRLTPGIAVLRVVFAAIDTDGDGALSGAEQRAYAERVGRDLSLAIDGRPVRLRLMSSTYPDIDEMMEGRGTIELAFDADVPPGGERRRLVFENRHFRGVAAYLVNALVPRDPDIRVTGQDRTEEQSRFRLDYADVGAGWGARSLAWWSAARIWFGLAVLSPLVALVVRWRRRPWLVPRLGRFAPRG